MHVPDTDALKHGSTEQGCAIMTEFTISYVTLVSRITGPARCSTVFLRVHTPVPFGQKRKAAALGKATETTRATRNITGRARILRL